MGVKTTTHPETIDGPPPGARPVLEGLGMRFELRERTATVGKADDADIRVQESGVSRHHAKLAVAADRTVTVLDLASTNGTYVNGTRVDVASLRTGDVIRFGPTASLQLRYRMSPAAKSRGVGVGVTLSARQLEVARAVADGLTNDEVAVQLGISPKTVKSHLDQIYRRLELGSRAALTRWLADADLLTSD